MKLLLDHQRAELLANGKANAILRDSGLAEQDFNPVVKLFSPWGAATWLLTELDPEDEDIAFGLCDLGMGFPKLGNVSLREIEEVTGPGGLRIERDIHFEADRSLVAYAEDARLHQRITV
ncbi:hypothetical protein ACVIHI_007970 [Bradyrhizobium sp. USDA 4524]|uniref:DUF2958 domain-containing protein n=1 Tax=unclassified Bradyrhizobium TaxID=2631580 RepID=UPI0020A082BB|nr:MULTISPECIES: DUF2958 domain-containing protein [unclassified Bradyrhizobium]MCP1839116.1 hypothetical protein [Bradyrhizobium sp. USDA 4538]MCP1899681.1 hypothetical protein [Bradyrhizobium sp. USDA 4537]MCP1986209.1 hypothetical protein [Bradyrhizobium sp. USDA 4539]